MSNDQSDDGGFQYSNGRTVSPYTDDIIALLIVAGYMGVWAYSKVEPSIQTPPLADAAALFMAQVAIAYVFGKRAVKLARENTQRR